MNLIVTDLDKCELLASNTPSVKGYEHIFPCQEEKPSLFILKKPMFKKRIN